MTNGQVQKIDSTMGKVTLAHGPIKSLGMDEGMTVVWPVQDASTLKALQVGDKVMFHAERVNGTLTITEIEKTK